MLGVLQRHVLLLNWWTQLKPNKCLVTRAAVTTQRLRNAAMMWEKSLFFCIGPQWQCDPCRLPSVLCLPPGDPPRSDHSRRPHLLPEGTGKWWWCHFLSVCLAAFRLLQMECSGFLFFVFKWQSTPVKWPPPPRYTHTHTLPSRPGCVTTRRHVLSMCCWGKLDCYL